MTDQKAPVQSAAAATVREHRAGNLGSLVGSSIGRKMIVAVTGLILMLFVIGHLLGNLQIFLGPAWINGYAQHLRGLSQTTAAKAMLASGGPQPQVAQMLDSAKTDLTQAESQIARCADAQGAAHRKYKL